MYSPVIKLEMYIIHIYYIFRSYSWSTNICGQKEWLLFPPGDEENLRDKLGNLPLDVTSQELRDIQKYPNAHKVRGPIRVIQNDGETIFIPRYPLSHLFYISK